MAAAEKSKFVFRRVEVFDPVFSIFLALLLAGACIAVSVAFDSPVSALALFATICGFWAINRFDSRRPICVSVRVDAPVVHEIDVSNDRVVAKVWVESGNVARLSRTLGRTALKPLRPGLRSLPLLLIEEGTSSAWVESGKLLHLDTEELRGALSVVLSAPDVSLELLVGHTPGRSPSLLGALVSSQEGSIQSWSADLRPVLPLEPVVPNFPR